MNTISLIIHNHNVIQGKFNVWKYICLITQNLKSLYHIILEIYFLIITTFFKKKNVLFTVDIKFNLKH